MIEALEAIADRFHPRERITAIRSLGSGNVNDTFLVTHNGSSLDSGFVDGAFVMQRLNTRAAGRGTQYHGDATTLCPYKEP